jgi:hypothetical protein
MHYERGLRSQNYWRVYKDLIKKAYMRLVEQGGIAECTAEEMIQQLLDYWVGGYSAKVVVNGKEVKEHGHIKDILTKYAGKELVIFFKDIDEKFCVAFYPDSGFCEIFDPTVMDEKEAEAAILVEQYRDIQPQDPWEGY